MITGITEVTQDPEKAGNALKVVSMRLRGMKGELEELGEEVDGNVTNISKMQGQVLNLTRGKVNIFNDAGEFKSTYEILQGIAGVWKELNTIEQADLLETVAGKHRANDFAAILSNWETVEDATVSATEAMGSAAKEHAKYVDSIQGRLDALKATFQAFSNTFLGTDLVKGVVSALTGLLDVLEKIVNTIGGLGTAGLIGGLIFGGRSLVNFNRMIGGGIKSFGDLAAAAGLAKASMADFFKTPMGFATIGTAAVAAISAVISVWQNHQEKLRKARQETIDTANAFDDSFGTFEQAYIKYADKAVLTVDEENELKSAIDGTIKALGDKSGALRDAAGAASEYVSNLDKIAQAELEQSRNLANSGKQAAKDQLQSNAWFTDSAGGVDTGSLLWQLTSLGLLSGDYGDISNADFELPHVDTKEWKAIEDIVTSDTYKKYFEKGTGWREGYNFRFQNSKDVGLDGYVEQLQLTQDIVDSLSEKASETGDDSYLDSDTYKEASESLEMMSSAVNDYIQQTYMAEKAQYQFKNGIATTEEEFYAMRESILASAAESVAARDAIGKLMNEEYADTFDLSSIESQMDYIESVTNGIEGMTSKKANTFETLLDMRVKVNNGECTVGDYTDYIAQANEAINSIENAETQEFLRVQLGLELDKDGNIEDEIKNLRDKLVRDLTDNGVSEEVASAFADGLSATELDAAVNLIASGEIDLQNFDADKAAREIEEEAQRIQDMTFTVDLELEVENLEKLNSAVAEALSGTGLSTEGMSAVTTMFEGLDNYDPSKLFERTANGIRLNTDEFRKMNNEYQKFNIDGLNKKMSALGDEYLETREELSNLTYGTDEYYAKASELGDLEAQINATEQLAAQYEGLASAYNEWQMAEEAGNQRDMYESVITGLETVENEISRGWADDGTIEFLELLTGRDLSSGNINKIKSAYESLDNTIKHTTYSVKDFFTVNEDGESTSDGVYNFLDAVGQLEEEAFGGKDVVKRDKNGNIISFDFKVAGGDDAIAEALGVSEELVQIMVRAADDAGFVVSMDGTYQQLDVLKEKAAEAAQQLKNTFKVTDHSFFKDSSEEGIVKDYNEAIKVWEKFAANKNADGTVNMSVEGAEEAFTLVSTLQSMVDQLNEPVYMELNTSQVEKDMQTPLSKLQEYERLTQTEHQLKLKGTDTSEIDTSQEEILDYFEGLEPEIKAQLGIKNLSRDELQAKIESGEIEVPATVDLQVEMNDTLKDMVNVALYNAGLIDDKELEARVDVSLYAKEVDTSDVKNKTEEAVEKAGGDDKTTETTTNVEVKAGEVDTSDVENKTKEVVENDAGETGTVEKSVDLEVKIDEYNELLQNLEDADKDIKIKVAVEGLDQVEKLNKNIDLATEIDGDVANLSEFVKGAESLSGLDDVISSHVIADIDGNVTGMAEFKINNLKTFADSAKDLKDFGSVTANINANITGNVDDTFEFKINNLKTFADNAKGLKDLGDVNANVEANITGNVDDTFEFKINNLKTFADSAKGLKDIGDVSANIDANINGNVDDTFEFKIDNLKTLADSAKGLKELGDIDVSVNADIAGNADDTFEYKIDNLKVLADSAKGLKDLGDIDISVSADVDGNVLDTSDGDIDSFKTFAEGAKALEGLEDIKANVEANISGNVDDSFEFKLNNLKTFAEGAKELDGLGDVEANVNANINGNVDDTFEFKLNNLQTFAEGAKELKGLGDVDANITANINGNVDDTFEYKINNLKVLADSAEGLKDIGDVDANINANISGNVDDTFEYKINNLKTFADSAKGLDNLGDVSANVSANIDGNVVDTGEFKINNLKVFADSAKGLDSLGNVDVNVSANVNGNVIDTGEGNLDNLKVFADSAAGLKSVGSPTANVTANIEGELSDGKVSTLSKFASAAQAAKAVGSVVISVTANVATQAINNAITLLRTVSGSGLFKNYNANVNVTAKVSSVDDAAVQNYKAPTKDGKAAYTVDSSKVDAWKAPDKTGKVTYTPSVGALTYDQLNKTGTITYRASIIGAPSGKGPAAGTAHAGGSTSSSGVSGRAFARGDWGIKGNGVALGGELGQELVVRDGKFFTIGDKGAEFFQYKKNDIVFNAAQTESLFKYGGIKGAKPRGTMLASGSAFASGSLLSDGLAFGSGSIGYGGLGRPGTGTSSSSSSSSSKPSSSKSSKSSKSKTSSTDKDTKKKKKKAKEEAKDFEETFDWIEIAIDRIERAIKKLDTLASSTYKSWRDRNADLASEMSQVEKEINLQSKAYNRYIKQANKVGLSEKWKKKVRNGEVNISTIKDEDLAEKIKEYQEWYEKAIDCEDAMVDLNEQLGDLARQRFDNIIAQFEGLLDVIDHTKTILDEFIAQSEAKGHIVSTNYYQALINQEKNNIKNLEEERDKLITDRDKAVADGHIKKKSEEWYSMSSEIDDVSEKIAEGNTLLLEYANNIREIDWQVFDLLQERISNVTKEAEFLIDLMSNDKLYVEEGEGAGQLTKEGMATMGLHGQNYNTNMYQADLYAKEIGELDKQIAKDPYDQELINRRQELLELQWESILAAEKEKDAIRDMVEEGIEIELDALQELIDKYNDAMDAQKD